jgi:hypothetical protein
MRRWFRLVAPLPAPVVVVLIKLPFVLTRSGLYGLDPYYHLYFAKMWTVHQIWPMPDDQLSFIRHDYNAWPGAHIIASSVSSLGFDPIEVMAWLPLLFLFLLDLAMVLILLNRTNLLLATLGGILFGLMDYIFLQTQWFIPELFGLVFIAVLIMNELKMRQHLLSYLILTVLLVTHHLSFLIGLMYWLIVIRSRPDKAQLIIMVLIAIQTLLFWDFAQRSTGFLPDIQNQIGGIHPAIVVVVAMAVLIVLKLILAVLYERFISGHEEESILGILKAWFGRPGYMATVFGLVTVIVITIVVYLSSVAQFDGIGIQPSKLVLLAGGILFMAFTPMERDILKVLLAFGLVLLLFILNPVLFEFLPLNVRFLEFLYLPGFIIIASGGYSFYKERPERARTFLMAVILLSPVLCADDTLRYMDYNSQRFIFSEEDLEFAEMIRNHTEEDAMIVPPAMLAGVIMGISERNTEVNPVRQAVYWDTYFVAVPYLQELAKWSPVYVVHSMDPLRYIEVAGEEVTKEDLEHLDATFVLVSHRFELIFEHGDHALYRFR